MKKPTKFFLNLEKQKAINSTVRHLIDDGKDITDLKEINACICKFYKNLFKKNVSKSDSEKKSFLNSIALPNVTSKSFDDDTKIFSKSLTEKLTNVLPELISSNQTAYVKNRCISESGRLISDVIEMCDILDISGYLVTMDIEKAFDSLDHDFLLFALKKFGFGENFIHWIKVLLNKQQSCVINGGFTTRYFNLEKGARQGDPISAYLFILALEVLFELIKNNADIRGITIINHAFLCTTFADDSTVFLNDLLSVKNLIDTFKLLFFRD